MSSYQVIDDVQEQINASVVNSDICSSKPSAVIKHQIEKKRSITTVADWNCQSPLNSIATASSAKISVSSTAEGKSIISSLSMSLERQDSIQYVPRKIPPCIIPAGQSTVIHLDNYTHFMAQRVTTTKTAIKRSEIISEVQQQQQQPQNKIIPSSSKSIVSCSSGNKFSGGGVVDLDLKVVLGGDSPSPSSASPYRCSNKNKTSNMNKEKMLDTKPARSKARGRKNSLALDYSQQKELNKVIDIKVIQEDPTNLNLKSILKKPKPNGRRKVLKPRTTRKTKHKNKNLIENATEQVNTNGKQCIEILANEPISSSSNINTTLANESKILSPCTYTMQSRKCLNEMTCPYLHSDFPCKYYYLNLKCPLDFKCQYMHNGPLEPKLMEALRNHILDLLSTKPTVVETYFIQQLHNIEDLSQRLQSFRNTNEQSQQVFEVIEVMDDDDDEDHGEEDPVLVIDESSGEVNDSVLSDTVPVTSTLITTNDSQISTLSNLQPVADKLDTLYQNFKETNTIIDEIDQKLKNLKTTANMTANEKILELQNIYELLREQEKRLPIYENLNTENTKEVSNIYNNIMQSNSTNEQQQHIVLVNPEIINDIQISGSQENHLMTTTNIDEESEVNNTNVPQESGIEIIANEILPQENGGIITNENLTENFNDNNNGIDITNLTPEQQFNDNLPIMNIVQESELPNDLDSIEENNTNNIYNTNTQNPNNEENRIDNRIVNNDVNSYINEDVTDNNNVEEITINVDHTEVESRERLNEILEKNISSQDLNNIQTQEEFNNLRNTQIPEDHNVFNDTLLPKEELELAITSDGKEITESHIDDKRNSEDINEEESPPYEQISTTKSLKNTHIRLRSHTHQDLTDIPKKDRIEQTLNTTVESIKPIKTRRLRLPKSSQKPIEKIHNEECQINADIINKLIKSTEKSETSITNTSLNESTFVQDVEIPLTQNVILTKRFMKKAKAKLGKRSELNESVLKATTNLDLETNVEQKMFDLHHEDYDNLNTIENVDVNQLTQTSDYSQPLNPSQDPLIVTNEGENMIETSNKKKNKSEPIVKITKNRRISFENPSSSSATTIASNIKEQFHLGNPHVVLTKIKTNFFTAPIPKVNIQADSTTTTTNTNVNTLVTSSSPSNLIAASASLDDKSTQKRHSFTSEYNLDSSVKENKYLKIDNVKAVRKVNFDTKKRTYSEQSASSKEEDEFDTDSSDEKLTIADALQTLSASSTGIQPSTTHKKTTTKCYYHPAASAFHQHVHKEQQENESDLRQQIENVSNKSDLQYQQQKHERQQKEMELVSNVAAAATTVNAISITKNSNNNLPHKQYPQQQENEKNYHHYHLSQPQQQTEKNFKKEKQIANTCNPYVNIEDRQIPFSISASFQRIDVDEHGERPTLNASDKYPNETVPIEKKEADIEYSTTYSSLYNKLSSSHSAKCQINFENSSVNITPISSPTYGDDTIASPSPVKKSLDFHMGDEVDGRLTYPPIPYILHEVDLSKIEINKPLYIDKLKKTIQVDPRIIRTHVKKQLMTLSKSTSKLSSTSALVPFNTTHFSQPPSACSSMIASPYDPRNRTPANIFNTNIGGHQSVLNPYNHINAASPSSSSTYLQNDILPNAVPLALQYHITSQPILQPQQQQTPNMFLYGCLQRSPWYQSLMSTMKIQINQSISQLVRALNNFHRERLINPELVFDVFKIDCAGELLEIMRNLGIFVDANGIINEKRHMPTFGGRSCCNTMPVNATYSFIQQVLTPNTHCTSLTTASSSYNTAGTGTIGGGSTVVGSSINMNEPFVSCYIKAPEMPQRKPLDDCCTTHNHHHQHCNSQENKNINNNNNNSYANNNCNCCHNSYKSNNSCGSSENNKNNNSGDSYGVGGSYCQNNNNSNNKRFGGYSDNKFKKPYDSYNNIDSNYRSSNQRSTYGNNPRFSKQGLSSPSRSANNSPPNSPRGGGGGSGSYDGGNSYSGGGFRGGRGRFNNRRFNNYNNNDKFNNGSGASGSSWFSNNDSNDNRYNNNSPTRSISPNASLQTTSPRTTVAKSSPSPVRIISGGKKSSDEECWD